MSEEQMATKLADMSGSYFNKFDYEYENSFYVKDDEGNDFRVSVQKARMA